MSKGENIFRRKDGRWEARFEKGRDPNGRIIYGYCYGKTYAEAKEKAAACRAAVLQGVAPTVGQPQPLLFSHYCDCWLTQTKLRVKQSSYLRYSHCLEQYLKPAFGGWEPARLTSGMIADFAGELLDGRGLAPKTVQDILSILRSVLAYISKEAPGTVAALDVVSPRVERQNIRVLTRAEQSRLAKYLLNGMDPCKFGVLLAMLTGLRIGELCALRWENWSAETKTLRITATLQRIPAADQSADSKTELVVTSPKSSSSNRTIPLTAFAASLCEQMAQSDLDTFLLTGTTKPMEPRTLQYRFAKYTRECGLPGVHFHTLRHTFATRAVEAGFEIKSLSEVLGHANASVTYATYVHASLDFKRTNMEKMALAGL